MISVYEIKFKKIFFYTKIYLLYVKVFITLLYFKNNTITFIKTKSF